MLPPVDELLNYVSKVFTLGCFHSRLFLLTQFKQGNIRKKHDRVEKQFELLPTGGQKVLSREPLTAAVRADGTRGAEINTSC